MLAFRKAITCLKRSSEATVAFIQRLGAEVGIREERSQGLGATSSLFVSLWGNWLGFLKCFCSMFLEKRILLDFLDFCAGTFPILWTLLPEVSSVVPFCIRE